MLKPLRTVGKSQGVEHNSPIAPLFGYFPRLKHRLRFLLKSSSALKVEALQLILHQYKHEKQIVSTPEDLVSLFLSHQCFRG
ncbi:hypothetical protein YC2023_075583 [Brassica napus]